MTPTKHEYAMYMAQSAALRSACLSRQVGAAILSKNGEVVATGCNDVPKKGGLYSTEDGDFDFRCNKYKDGECFNDKHKKEIKNEIKNILSESLKSKTILNDVAEKIANETRLKDLIEFSRSIHAEMDAIMNISRNSNFSLKGSSLYSTTFPCHNCAKYIITAGIEKVYYIEPYEKSLAVDLHSDSISLEPTESEYQTNKVIFLHFEGVAPRQYLNLFQSTDNIKKDGKLIKTNIHEAYPVIPEYLGSYKDFEAKVIDNLQKFDDFAIDTEQ